MICVCNRLVAGMCRIFKTRLVWQTHQATSLVSVDSGGRRSTETVARANVFATRRRRNRAAHPVLYTFVCVREQVWSQEIIYIVGRRRKPPKTVHRYCWHTGQYWWQIGVSMSGIGTNKRLLPCRLTKSSASANYCTRRDERIFAHSGLVLD